MRTLPVRDELFLLAHDDAGRIVADEQGLNVALAGAALIDLLVMGRAGVEEGRLVVHDPPPPGDAEVDALVAAIIANTAPCGPRAWVSWISPGAYDRISQVLEEAGRIRRVADRRFGLLPRRRCWPVDSTDLVRVRAKLRFAICSSAPVDPATAALCDLAAVLRLSSVLLLNQSESAVVTALRDVGAAGDPIAHQVVATVESVMTMASYR